MLAFVTSTQPTGSAIALAHWYLLRKQYPSRYLVIATTNIKHFEEFAEALNWEDINLS